MHSLSIVFGPTGTNWRLLFRSEDRLKSALQPLSIMNFDDRVAINDDFGQIAVINAKEIHGWMIEDLDQTKLAAIEMSVHNGRAQADAEQAMRADPKIMSSVRSRSQGGPPILAPMGNGFTR